MKTFVILFFVVQLTACATKLAVPGHTNSPTTLGEGVLSASGGVASEPHVRFKDSNDSKVYPSEYFLSPPNAIHFKLGYGITDRIDTGLLFDANVESNSLILDLSYQWLGVPIYKTKQGDLNSTVRLSLIGQYDRGKAHSVDIIEKSVMGLGFSLSNSFGYMISDWLSFYGGGRAIYILANYEIKKDSSSKTTNSHLWYFGPVVGVQLSTTGSIWKVVFTIEGNFTSIPVAAGFYKKNDRWWIPGYSGILSVLYQF